MVEKELTLDGIKQTRHYLPATRSSDIWDNLGKSLGIFLAEKMQVCHATLVMLSLKTEDKEKCNEMRKREEAEEEASREDVSQNMCSTFFLTLRCVARSLAHIKSSSWKPCNAYSTKCAIFMYYSWRYRNIILAEKYRFYLLERTFYPVERRKAYFTGGFKLSKALLNCDSRQPPHFWKKASIFNRWTKKAWSMYLPTTNFSLQLQRPAIIRAISSICI